MLIGLCEAKTADKAAENVDTVMQKSALQNFRNVILKIVKSERHLYLNFVLFKELIYLLFVEPDLLIRQVLIVASESITKMQTASFPEEEFQRFKFAQISHPLSVEIVDQVSLVHKDFSVPALACAYGLHLALLHEMTDGVFGKSLNDLSAFLDSQHLNLVRSRCGGGLRNGVLSVLGELNQQLQNVVNDLFLLCSSHSVNLSLSMVCVLSFMNYQHFQHNRSPKMSIMLIVQMLGFIKAIIPLLLLPFAP